jgi:hypothetical protein
MQLKIPNRETKNNKDGGGTTREARNFVATRTDFTGHVRRNLEGFFTPLETRVWC